MIPLSSTGITNVSSMRRLRLFLSVKLLSWSRFPRDFQVIKDLIKLLFSNIVTVKRLGRIVISMLDSIKPVVSVSVYSFYLVAKSILIKRVELFLLSLFYGEPLLASNKRFSRSEENIQQTEPQKDRSNEDKMKVCWNPSQSPSYKVGSKYRKGNSYENPKDLNYNVFFLRFIRSSHLCFWL